MRNEVEDHSLKSSTLLYKIQNTVTSIILPLFEIFGSQQCCEETDEGMSRTAKQKAISELHSVSVFVQNNSFANVPSLQVF